MADEKKYSAREAAMAVLKKAEEMLNKSEVLKKVAGKEPQVLNKSEKPAGEIMPKEQVQGEPTNPGDRIEEQTPPDINPKEQKEGNNKEWGTAPETYGTLKLAKFLGHMESKRKRKSTPGAQ